MNAVPVAISILALSAMAGQALAQTTTQPPMNDFYQAFYNCDGGAFLVTYDTDTPMKASLTIAGSNKPYVLSRMTAPSGVQFSTDTIKFWTDGKTVTVTGTAQPLKNCKMKPAG